MTKEKSIKIAKIISPILIIAIIGGIWFLKNKPNDNLDSAVQTTDIAAVKDDNVDKDDLVNTTVEVANTDAVTDSTNDVANDSVIEKSEAVNKDSIQNTESTGNSTINVSEEANKTLNNNEKPANSEVSVTEGKLETQTETAKNTEAPVSTKKPETTNADFDLAATKIDLEKLKSYGLPIIIDFGADSCVPCKLMAPVLKKLNADLQGKVIVKFVDVWKYKNAVGNFPVEVIPTQFFFDKNGKPYVPSDPDKMQMNMYSTKDTNLHVYTSHQGGMTEEQILAVLAEMGTKQ